MGLRYKEKFYLKRRKLAYQSAKNIIPVIKQFYQFDSVADFGCADGVWLSVFNELGINDFVGVDGPWVNQDRLLIPLENFSAINFSNQMPKFDRTFDLSICIEVVEHLSDERGKYLISNLCNVSNIILFSAAVPCQGGTGHVNEQRQSYWKEEFDKHDFLPYDIIRKTFWSNETVNVIYKQNMFLYISKFLTDLNERLEPWQITDDDYIDLIHPDLYELRVSKLKQQRRKPNIVRRIKRKALSVVFDEQ
ncbi:MAG: class I SAM-dependent methyltransferase [Sneathiella sp.]|nr:class I SAM-dependent methyltransferase [Sneathiella sp.]